MNSSNVKQNLISCQLSPAYFKMPVTKPPRIVLWNAQGITTAIKQKQLEHYAHSEKIDIILIVETFLKPEHSFNLMNYVIYRIDRIQQAHGGVAIAVRNIITPTHRSPFKTKFIENASIVITVNNTPTIITVAYCPKYSNHFAHDILSLTASHTQFMVFGDFNAKHRSWNCTTNNKTGDLLFDLQQQNSFMIHHPREHTHFPHSGQSPSTIDIALSNANFAFDLSTHRGHLFSDHEPVICTIDDNIKQSQRKIYDYKNADWPKYQHLINSNIHRVMSPTSNQAIDNAVSTFSTLILEALDSSVPVKAHKNQSKISYITKRLIQAKCKNIRKKIFLSDCGFTFNDLPQKQHSLVIKREQTFHSKRKNRYKC